MASYGPVRSSPQVDDDSCDSEGASDPGEEEVEVAEKPGPQDHDAEQNEGLLSVEPSDAEAGDSRERLSRRRTHSTLGPVLSVIIIFCIVVFDIWLLFRPDDPRKSSSSSGDPAAGTPGAHQEASGASLEDLISRPLRRLDEDYILLPNWDFKAPSQIRYYNWTIVDRDGNPDGVYKPMMTINGQYPGPLIEANEGDTIVVDVMNLARNATAIHWHGIFQNGTNYMDGTSGVTQCPIASGRSFQYKFTVKGQSGTYFYHGHQGVQSLDGLLGPLVIHGRHEADTGPVPYDSDRVVILQDWYYDPGSGLLRDSLSPGNEASPIPNTALINGLNRADCNLHPGRRCDSQGTYLPTMKLRKWANHRLRFINAGGFAWFQVSIDQHPNLRIVEIDATAVEPAPEQYLTISPGQRYSVVITADASDSDAFWLRARMIKHCFSVPKIPENGVDEARGVIRYTAPTGSLFQKSMESTPQDLPTTENTVTDYLTQCKDMTSRRSYHPSPPKPAPGSADRSWFLRVNLAIGDWRLERGYINQSSLRPNLKQPTLYRLLDGLTSANESFAVEGLNDLAFHTPSELVVSHAGIQTVDIIIQNMDEGNHPFHLHGTQVWVLGAGHGYFPGYESLNLKPEGRGLLDPSNRTVIENPVKRDTVTVEGFGWVLLRFVADNPGVWLFHCHMTWHSEAGMGMQFVSRIEDLKTMNIPKAQVELCDAAEEELVKGAPPKDEIFFGFHDDD